jgi:hypothetical protein
MENVTPGQAFPARRRGRPKKTVPIESIDQDGGGAGIPAPPFRHSIEPSEYFIDIETAAFRMGNLPISTMYQLVNRPHNPMPARRHGKRLAFYWPELKAWSDRENGLASFG